MKVEVQLDARQAEISIFAEHAGPVRIANQGIRLKLSSQVPGNLHARLGGRSRVTAYAYPTSLSVFDDPPKYLANPTPLQSLVGRIWVSQNPPSLFAQRLGYNRVFVERGGSVYYGCQNQSAAINRKAHLSGLWPPEGYASRD